MPRFLAGPSPEQMRTEKRRIRIAFKRDEWVFVRESSFVPDVGDLIDLPVLDGPARIPLVTYRVTERRWLFPEDPDENQVLLKLESVGNVNTTLYPGVEEAD